MKLKLPLLLVIISFLTMGAAAPVRMTPVKIAENVYMLQHSQGSGNSTVVFTNDGVLLPVTFLKRDGDVIGKQIISTKTARVMAQMLETVTEQGGTATKSQVSGYRISGKTGTAYKLVNGQYAENQYLSSFVGYGPSSNPRYIIAVSIDDPSAGKYFGGDVSAPVFSKVMSQALRMSGVLPDAESLREARAAPQPASSVAKERG